jgi:hypothetical protein
LIGDEGDLRSLPRTLDPTARDDLRRVLIRDQADQDAMYPDARRQVVRVLGETSARANETTDVLEGLTCPPVPGTV